jgi:ankyrin repeat protein
VISPYCFFHEPKLCFLMLILLLVFRYGSTQLHLSAHEGQLEVCRLLLQSGADANARDL